MSGTTELINKLKANVEAMRKNKCSMDKASHFPYEGITISGNEAAQIVDLLECKATIDDLVHKRVSAKLMEQKLSGKQFITSFDVDRMIDEILNDK